MAFTAKSDANLHFFFGLAKTLREFFYNYELGKESITKCNYFTNLRKMFIKFIFRRVKP